MGKYLDKSGLARLWDKVKSTLGGYMRTDGANSISLMGGNGNKPGWRLVIEHTVYAWWNGGIAIAVSSRHSGQGVLSIGFNVFESISAYGYDIRLYGAVGNMSEEGTWRAFYNKDTRKFRLYLYYYDYNDTFVNILSRRTFNILQDGTWYETLPTDNGTELSIKINRADMADALNSQGRRTALSGTTSAPEGLRMYEVYNNGYPTSYGNLLSVCGAASHGNGELLLGWSATSGAVARLYYRNKRDQGDASWSAWSTVAFTTDNVASATRLATARTLWGQNFDGTANVSGSMTNVPAIVNENYVHRLELGRQNFNHWDFYEYGGIFNFYKCQSSTGASKTLIFKIDNGNVTLPGTLTAAKLSGQLAYSNLTDKPDVINMLEGYNTFLTSFSQSGNSISVGESDSNTGAGYMHTVNFKTVNGASLIGNGNISIETGPKAIAKGTDLGTIKEPGMYHWDYSGQGATSSADAPKNMPKSLAWNDRFTMLVAQAGASTAWQVIPADSYTPTKFYARTIATTGTTAVNRSWYVFDLSSLRELDA